MYENLINLPYPEFEKEVLKIYKNNLQTPEKIEKEKRVVNYEKGEVLGVKSDIRNAIKKTATKRKNLWNEIKKLWKLEINEFRGIAQSMIYKAKKSDNEKLNLVFKLIPTSLNWSDTDGLVVHEMKDVIRRNPETAFEYSEKHINSKNKWERRFSMVVLIPLTNKKENISRILKLAEKLLKDPEPYVQKAVSWAIKQGHEHSQDLIFDFLKKHAHTTLNKQSLLVPQKALLSEKDKNQIKIIRLAMEYQTKERKEELREIIK